MINQIRIFISKPALLAVLFLCLLPLRSVALYTVTDLGILTNLPSGTPEATINSVSLNGKAIGITVSNGNYSSFIYGGTRTNLGTLGGNYCSAQVIGGPSGNIICGKSTLATGFEHAFRWTLGGTNGVSSNPQMADLGTLGGNFSAAFDMNLSGQMAGDASYPGDSFYSACRFETNGTITDIGGLMPGFITESYGYGINALGHIAGTAYDPNGNQAFLFNGTNVLFLGDLTGFNGNAQSEAFAISTSRHITGYSVNGSGEYHAFRWVTNSMTDLGTLGGPESGGWGINNSNVIVGLASIDLANQVFHAFIASNNVMADLNGLLDASSNGWVLIKAEYINDAGMIVGYGTNNGTLHGFLLNPASSGIAPVITNNPSAASVIVSNNATFTVVAGGTAPLSYQWRFNTTTNILGATNASLTITNCQATNAGNYRVVITNSFGSITSSPATLTVNFPPSITNSPAATSVVVSNLTSFTVGASGTATLAYQWRINGTNIAYGIGATLSITNAQATNAGNYTVVVTNNYGSVTSSPATLTVNFPPNITNQPTPISVLTGNNATFSVGATGTATLVYQWRINGTNIGFGTGSSFTITNAQATNAGNYTVVVTNNYGSVTSSPAALAVNFPPSISTPPSAQSVLVGSNATFNVVATGTSPLAYQWKYTANLSGQTNTTYTVTNAQAGNAGNYSVIVTNGYGSVTSGPAYLNVVPAPTLASISVTDANVLIGFNTSTGATYSLEARTNLSSGSWQSAITNIAGTGGLKSVTHTNGALNPSQTYRVRVNVP